MRANRSPRRRSFLSGELEPLRASAHETPRRTVLTQSIVQGGTRGQQRSVNRNFTGDDPKVYDRWMRRIVFAYVASVSFGVALVASPNSMRVPSLWRARRGSAASGGPIEPLGTSFFGPHLDARKLTWRRSRCGQCNGHRIAAHSKMAPRLDHRCGVSTKHCSRTSCAA
jgi:hypothetical protein